MQVGNLRSATALPQCFRAGQAHLTIKRQARALRLGAAASSSQPTRSSLAPQTLPAAPQHVDKTIASLALWALASLPADAAELGTGAASAQSYYVSLALFVMTVPGLWSLIKRSPKAKVKRKTFEVDGPGVEGAVALDARARQIFGYFKEYNYEVKSTGEVITFEGKYKASISQALSLVLYTLVGLGSTALVLSIAAPWGGNWWYSMCLVSPAAGAYYYKNANRTEEVKVKMTTSDDDSVTEITVEGDEEEIERMRKQLKLMEKGKVYVKGILER